MIGLEVLSKQAKTPVWKVEYTKRAQGVCTITECKISSYQHIAIDFFPLTSNIIRRAVAAGEITYSAPPRCCFSVVKWRQLALIKLISLLKPPHKHHLQFQYQVLL